MEIKEAIIKKEEWLPTALKRLGYDSIPTNTILNKTLTGLGATHSEIHSKRNSIIIEPNVSVILGKLNNNENLEAVYEKCTPHSIKKYLKMDIPYKKILCTPESFYKIRKAAEDLKINIYKNFFCLFDECEKITQDVDFRRKITQPIYDFFKFEKKAFVSATPLPMSHKDFEHQNFQMIKIKPDFDYKKNLDLIVTNSYYKVLKEVLEKMKDSKHICIFFNVTDGINEIINNLGVTDYKIFCSQKSVDKLAKRGIREAYSTLESLTKYNFFTCRFYSGVDIVLGKYKPDIIMLTDFNSANWTMLDPFTESIQIQGRFRKSSKYDDITYNSLTHITTINPNMIVRSKKDIDKKISQFIENYNNLRQSHDKEIDEILKEALFEDMCSVKCNNFLDERNEINTFSIDNLYNEERVKSYYVSAQSLYQAYEDTGFFNVVLHKKLECVGDDDFKKLNKIKYEIDRRKYIVCFLERINNEPKIGNEEKIHYIHLLEALPNGVETVRAFEKIGKDGFEKAQYKKSLIEKSLKQYEKDQVEKLRFSSEVLRVVKETFIMNIYISKVKLQSQLRFIYENHQINYKVTQETIKDYYETSTSNSKEEPALKLKKFRFE